MVFVRFFVGVLLLAFSITLFVPITTDVSSNNRRSEIDRAMVPTVYIILSRNLCRVGDAVNITVRLRDEVGCFCLFHKWHVYIVDSNGAVVFELHWTAKVGEYGYREKSFTWIPMKPGVYRVFAELHDGRSWGCRRVIVN